jgi:hypothetical protein
MGVLWRWTLTETDDRAELAAIIRQDQHLELLLREAVQSLKRKEAELEKLKEKRAQHGLLFHAHLESMGDKDESFNGRVFMVDGLGYRIVYDTINLPNHHGKPAVRAVLVQVENLT